MGNWGDLEWEKWKMGEEVGEMIVPFKFKRGLETIIAVLFP